MTADTTHLTGHAPETSEFGSLYAEVQQFYAHQMQLFDRHEAERWAATFTEDAVFSVPTLDSPVHGRAELAANVHHNRARQEREGGQLRHWIGMLDVDVRPGGVLHTRAYALVFATPRGGVPVVSRFCVMADELVRCRGRLRVRSRVVSRDDLTAGYPAPVLV